MLSRESLKTLGCGAEGSRTPDPHNAIVVLYQLSYDPIRKGSDTVEIGPSFVKDLFAEHCVHLFGAI